MRLTYDQIRKDSEIIALEFGAAKSEIPSFFSPLKRVRVILVFYFICSVLTYFFLPQGSDKLAWFGMFTFGVINWLFILGFVFGYDYLFSMVSNQKTQELKLVRVIRKKLHCYGLVWLGLLTILAGVSVFSELNVAALVIGNFLITLFGLFIFNVDISRYQVAGLIGASSAIKQSLKD